MIKAILFDLDGTLLPMDQDSFVNQYLNSLAQKLAPYGYDPQLLIKAIWKSTHAMAANTGDTKNETIFWECLSSVLGEQIRQYQNVIEDYYRNEFQLLRNVCGYTPLAAQYIKEIKAMGLRTILATNPFFPAIATHSRLRWAGLKPEDFELITTYDNSSRCKPNPAYYMDILKSINLSAQECIMVGNDATEDFAAQSIGIPVFLLTKCLINRENRDISNIPHGDFTDFMTYLQGLML